MIRLKLNEIMKQKKLSITEVSKATGIARSTLTPIVNNPEEVKAIRFETIDKLCSYLDIELQELVEYKQNEIENKIIGFWLSKNHTFGIIELKRSTLYNEKSGFISFSMNRDVVSHGDEVEVINGSYTCSLEIMTEEEIMTLNTKFGDFKIKNKVQAMEQTDLKKILKKMDRKELMDLTMKIVSSLMFNEIFGFPIELIEVKWSIGSIILDSIKNSFTFKIDATNNTIINISYYEELNDKERFNYNFDISINKLT